MNPAPPGSRAYSIEVTGASLPAVTSRHAHFFALRAVSLYNMYALYNRPARPWEPGMKNQPAGIDLDMGRAGIAEKAVGRSALCSCPG